MHGLGGCRCERGLPIAERRALPDVKDLFKWQRERVFSAEHYKSLPTEQAPRGVIGLWRVPSLASARGGSAFMLVVLALLSGSQASLAPSACGSVGVKVTLTQAPSPLPGRVPVLAYFLHAPRLPRHAVARVVGAPLEYGTRVDSHRLGLPAGGCPAPAARVLGLVACPPACSRLQLLVRSSALARSAIR